MTRKQQLAETTKPMREPVLDGFVSNGQRNETALQSGDIEPPPVDRDSLCRRIQLHLETIGLNRSRSDKVLSKAAIRHVHRFHRDAAQKRIREALGNKMDQMLEEIADGNEVTPERIHPELVEVHSGHRTGDLFRFATLLWSIPVSQGYGRRLRYLVRDRNNGKLIGVFALGDPVFNLRVRDEWIGWNQADRRERLVNLMDAYVVGAIPPYSDLLGGKLVTSLIASEEVANRFEERYGSSVGLISGKRKQARLTLITVTSALGRSSLYNRLKLIENARTQSERTVVKLLRLGTTAGYGHFQIADGLFSQLRRVLQEDGHKYADGHQFGDGPNWRIRVTREGLKSLDLNPNEVLKHGIQREVYAMPIALNSREYLSGSDSEPTFDHRTVGEISALARKRWVVPRSERKPHYRAFRRQQVHDTLTGRSGVSSDWSGD